MGEALQLHVFYSKSRTRNNTDSNKLVIFSGIALYYDDTYIVFKEI